MRRHRHISGFSLLEMSIVLLIIAIVAGGGAVMLSASVEKRQYDETNEKMRVIQKALLDYRRAFNRLPCPGDLTLASTNAEFGLEAGKTTNTVESCAGDSPAANYTSTFFTTANDIDVGALPVRTLGLPDDYMFDGWGRRFTYAVDNRFTVVDAFNNIDVSEATEVRIMVLSASIATKTTSAAYVLLSHGETGQGAYSREGDRIYVGIAGATDGINCNCTGVGDVGTIYGMYIQAPPSQDPADPTDINDDIVVYATRQHLRSSDE